MVPRNGATPSQVLRNSSTIVEHIKWCLEQNTDSGLTVRVWNFADVLFYFAGLHARDGTIDWLPEVS